MYIKLIQNDVDPKNEARQRRKPEKKGKTHRTAECLAICHLLTPKNASDSCVKASYQISLSSKDSCETVL